MERVFFTFALVFILGNAKAQIGAGKWFLGGAFGFSIEQTKTTKSGVSTKDGPAGHFGFYPNLGYFINDRIAVGSGVGYLAASINKGTSTSGLFGVSPFIRKYYKIGKQNNFYFFGQFSIDFGTGYTKDISTLPTGEKFTSKNNVTSFGFGLAPGFALFPAKRFATEFTCGYIPFSVIDRQNYLLGYTHITTKPDPNPSNQKTAFGIFGFGIRSIIATSLTFKYYFGGKKEENEKSQPPSQQ